MYIYIYTYLYQHICFYPQINTKNLGIPGIFCAFLWQPGHQRNGALRVERRERLVAVQAVIDLGLPRDGR